MTLEYSPDHVERALERLPFQFKQAPVIQAVLTALARQLQEVEDALWQLRLLRSIDDSEGKQLDTIGDIVGQPRGGLPDNLYRAVIRGRIAANRSLGEYRDFHEVMALIYGVESAWTIRDYYPAGLMVLNLERETISGPLLGGLLQIVRLAGVRALYGYQVTDPDRTYTLVGLDDPPNPSQGMGDVNDDDAGGRFAGVTEGQH